MTAFGANRHSRYNLSCQLSFISRYFFLKGNCHAETTLGVLTASKLHLQPAKPVQQERQRSGPNVPSQTFFSPSLLSFSLSVMFSALRISLGSCLAPHIPSVLPHRCCHPGGHGHICRAELTPLGGEDTARRPPRASRTSAARCYLQD